MARLVGSPISRRRLLARAGLAGVGILGVAGAGGAVAALADLPARSGPRPEVTAGPTPSPTASTPTELDAALARERVLLAAATAAQEADPSHPLLAEVAADHRAHAEALAGLIGTAVGSAPPPAVTPTVEAIVTAEQAAASACATAAGTVTGAGAVLLASISACEAGHVELLA